MLDINWADVQALVASVGPQLITIGVVLLLAIGVTIAVRKLKPPTRKFARAQTWIAAVLVVAISVTTMLYGGFRNLLDLASGSGTLSEETMASASELGNQISDEGMVLLKNQTGTLPLAGTTKVNVFGWASTNPVYGGTGSGSLSATQEVTSLLGGLANAGFETNQDLSNFYTAYRADRPVVGMFTADWTLPEPAAATYPADLLAGAKAFSDTSIVTISRTGGEGYDLPQNVNAEVASNGAFSFTNNSTEYNEFADGDGILQLTRSERDMIDLAKQSSETLVVVYNGANAMELGELADDPEVDAIVWALPPGQVGFNALGRILDGETNPSAKTPDTFVRDLGQTPTAKNFGGFTYTNMDEFAQTSFFTKQTVLPSFVNYVEGIYVGYRFWETAAAEGAINYDASIVYPFGYGLSYTTFTQQMGPVSLANGKVSFDVTVTNTGDVAGKDVVEAYYNPPYTEGGIEKSAVNLVAYDKTELLAPGASQTITVTFDDDDMASYDVKNGGAYVLEAGRYDISLRSDSHTVIDTKPITVDQTITYNTADSTHDGDLIPATNQFDAAKGEGITYLSRAGNFANYAQSTAAPASSELAADLKATFVVNSNYDPTAFNNASDVMPTTGAKNGLVLGDLAGADFNDPRWEQLLDQMTFDEMNTLIANGGYQTPAANSVGKIQTIDVDGPAALNNNFTGVGSIGLPISVSVAATFNQDLAHQFGTVIGKMAEEMNVSGWYAPAMNIHRSAYAGRNFEYFSEDPILSGNQVAQQVTGARELGVYAFIKHFALNDQETNRNNMLMTWAEEQSIREIYLRPFEIAVKDGGAQAVMSAFNFIGTVYAGAMPELLQTVLRDQWGFQGMVLTDYFGGYGYQNADRIVRGGGDVMLATVDMGINYVQDRSATSVIEMRRAAKNILFTTGNSRVYADGQPEVTRAPWEFIAWGVLGALGLALIGLEVVAIKRFQRRRNEAAQAMGSTTAGS